MSKLRFTRLFVKLKWVTCSDDLNCICLFGTFLIYDQKRHKRNRRRAMKQRQDSNSSKSSANNKYHHEDKINSIKHDLLLKKQLIAEKRKLNSRNSAPRSCKHRTLSQQLKDGALDIDININNIELLLLQNGAKMVDCDLFKDYNHMVTFQSKMSMRMKSMIKKIVNDHHNHTCNCNIGKSSSNDTDEKDNEGMNNDLTLNYAMIQNLCDFLLILYF